jgi:copper homeostasis protein
MVLLDIACTTLEDALQAEQGGANSLELSVDLAADGLTPSLLLVQTVRNHVRIPLHVILRVHARNFIYSHTEKAAMVADSRAIAPFCDGFVVGALLDNETFDVAWIRILSEIFPSHRLTLHRALDYASNPIETLEHLQGVAHRVLASGSRTTAWDGRKTLHHWVQRFGSQYSFVAAGSVNHEIIAPLIVETGVQECHSASAVRRDGIVAADLVRDLRTKAI